METQKQSDILNEEYVQYVKTLKGKKYRIAFNKVQTNELISILSKYGEFKYIESKGLVDVITEWKQHRNTLTGASKNEELWVTQTLLEATIYFVSRINGRGVEDAIKISEFLEQFAEPFVEAQKVLQEDRDKAKQMEDAISQALLEETEQELGEIEEGN